MDFFVSQQIINMDDVLVENFKSGDFIVVVKKPNSHLNVYKGYYGEIRDYRKGQDSAMVLLDAINSSKPIQFPIAHLKKVDNSHKK